MRRVEVEEVARAVAALPAGTRRELARGPWAEGCRSTVEACCRLCGTLRAGGLPIDLETRDPDSPGGVLWRYHESKGDLLVRALTDTVVEGEPDEHQVAAALAIERHYDRREPRIIDALYRAAGAVSYHRLLIVYLLAGWRPE